MSDAATVLRGFLEEVWNARRLDRFGDFVSERVVLHPVRGPPRGFAQYKEMAREFQAAFSDLRFEIEHVGAQGDLAFARIWLEGTQDGPWHGRAATGKRMRVVGQPQCRVEGGKIVAFYQLFDELGALQQLGHL